MGSDKGACYLNEGACEGKDFVGGEVGLTGLSAGNTGNDSYRLFLCKEDSMGRGGGAPEEDAVG